MTRPVQRRLLLVTNDFPPRPGGIQSFLYGVVSRLPADEVVVLTSRWRGWAEWDAAQAFTVIRHDTRVMLPTPAVRRHAVEVFRGSGCTDVWFGAAAPLGLLAPALREAGARRIVATTHGHEIGWGAIPGARSLLRRIAGDVDVLTYLGEYTRARLARAIGPRADRLQRLTPGVDTDLFSPEVDGGAKRAKLGWSERPVVVCVSRLMPRKGQDVLVRALPELRRRAGDVGLLLVGGGPSRSHLESLAKEYGVVDSVYITGSVPFEQLPSYYRAGDVFAMPCRERLQGLDVEGLGMVFLEAAACGLPVVAGRSGGSTEAVIDGENGLLVDGGDVMNVADAICELLLDKPRARAMGARGREWTAEEWTWQSATDCLSRMLDWA
ncbi:MAG TPA: glycosyltransferase family 4 protein [Mycobacteriales bacterium]|jgi:phosphatidylinositol alpha-1,6-mannosyltransferase|nr:glycosyltransferase family 4 protein [Mycobacteriales bacterium]HVX69343.1 glycosyltransferase family 4 protein [Mycobacteriales bacterium]